MAHIATAAAFCRSRRQQPISLGMPLGQLAVLEACQSTPEARQTLRRYSPKADSRIKRANLQLLNCASEGDLRGLRYWLRQGATLNARDGNKDTALILASRHGHTQLVRYLLLKSSNSIDFFDQKRDTALLNAVKGGHIDTVYLLLSHGAHLMGNNAMSIEEIASRHGHENIMRLLVQWRIYQTDTMDSQAAILEDELDSVSQRSCLRRFGCRPAHTSGNGSHRTGYSIHGDTPENLPLVPRDPSNVMLPPIK